MSGLLSVASIFKEYQRGSYVLQVLRDLDLNIEKGEAICIMGPSGAGKSTFLHILGTLDTPTSGDVFYQDQNLSSASERERTQFRRKKMGFVFQFHYLLQEFNMMENIMIAGQIGGMNKYQARENALRLIQLLNLEKRQTHFPSELSGGEQQRVALARALMNRPEILLLDEPTGNLDTQNSNLIMEVIFELRQKMGLTIIAVSHDSHFARPFPRVLKMKDGRWES